MSSFIMHVLCSQTATTLYDLTNVSSELLSTPPVLHYRSKVACRYMTDNESNCLLKTVTTNFKF